MDIVHYTTLADGTPVEGMYDLDGVPFLVRIDWQGVFLMTDGTSEISMLQEDFSFAAWGRLRELVTSGVVEELLPIARRFLASPVCPPAPPEPIELPIEIADDPELAALWHKLTPPNQHLIQMLCAEFRGLDDATFNSLRHTWLERHPQFAA